MTTTIRAAGPADHAVFARLFPLLEVDDPILEAPRWEAELMPGTLIAEDADGRPVGYAYWQVLGTLAYVRHIVVAKNAQGGGVGRRLMDAIAAAARARGAERWCLNVKPDNAPAIALYERCGLSAAHRTKAIAIAWAAVDARSDGFTVGVVRPEDDAGIEATLGFVPGIFADARKKGGRALVKLVEGESTVGAAVFDPAFPGAYPFRVARPDVAFALLAALRPHARTEDPHVNVVVEGQPEVADHLLARGAEVRHDAVHMTGTL